MTDEEWAALGIPPPPPAKADPEIVRSVGIGFPPFALVLLAILPVLAAWALTR